MTNYSFELRPAGARSWQRSPLAYANLRKAGLALAEWLIHGATNGFFFEARIVAAEDEPQMPLVPLSRNDHLKDETDV